MYLAILSFPVLLFIKNNLEKKKITVKTFSSPISFNLFKGAFLKMPVLYEKPNLYITGFYYLIHFYEDNKNLRLQRG